MSPIVKFALILAIVLILVGAFIVVLRRMTGGKLVPSGSERSRLPRLGIVDVYDLDRSRQLVLLRRDNVEHLILIGGPNDTVIETNIVRVASGKATLAAEAERTEYGLDASSRLIPEHHVRPVVEAGIPPYGQGNPGAEQEPLAYTYPEAAYNPQAAVPPATSHISAPPQAAVAATSLAAVAAATQYGQAVAEGIEADVPDFLRGPRDTRLPEEAEPPAPAEQAFQGDPLIFPAFPKPVRQPFQSSYQEEFPISETVEAQEPPAHSQPPVVHGSGYYAPYTQELAETAPAQQAEPLKDEAAFAAIDSAISEYVQSLPQTTSPQQETPLPAEEISTPETQDEKFSPAADTAETPDAASPEENPIHLDEAILSDMARHLEEALKGINANTAPAETTAMTEEEPVADWEPALSIEDTQTADQQELDAVDPPPSQTEEVISHLAVEEPPYPENGEPDASDGASTDNKAAAPSNKKEKAPPQKTTSPKESDEDPFSLDDIEAEFARLLGRTEDKPDKT